VLQGLLVVIVMATRKEKLRAHIDRLVWFICIAQIVLALTSVSCDIRSNGVGRNNSANVPTSSPSPLISPVNNAPPVTTKSLPASRIKTIDFKNFSYPWYPSDYTPPHGERKITLHNGEMKVEAARNTDRLWASLANVSYADLTGDDQEEAIVTVTTNFDPNGSVACIFVYTLKSGEPRLLWSHETGDRANGGLRSLRIEGFDLLVEQYDIKFDSAKGSYEEATALCCPKRFIRSHYRWNGEHFEKSKSETLTNEYDNARFLGYPSDRP
jgi:hypothetical protein